jgi:hypothetical protein
VLATGYTEAATSVGRARQPLAQANDTARGTGSCLCLKFEWREGRPIGWGSRQGDPDCQTSGGWVCRNIGFAGRTGGLGGSHTASHTALAGPSSPCGPAPTHRADTRGRRHKAPMAQQPHEAEYGGTTTPRSGGAGEIRPGEGPPTRAYEPTATLPELPFGVAGCHTLPGDPESGEDHFARVFTSAGKPFPKKVWGHLARRDGRSRIEPRCPLSRHLRVEMGILLFSSPLLSQVGG